MATEQLLLASTTTPDNWSLVVGGSKVAACQTTDDDDSSYIESGTSAPIIQMFALADAVDISAEDTINSVTIRVRHMRGGTPAGILRSVLATSGGTLASGSVQTGNTWGDWIKEWTYKPGGGPWTLSALQELTAGIEKTSGNKTIYCTTVEVIVDYTPAAAYYHGLSVQGVGEIALADVGSHPLRIYGGETIYGIPLVEVSDPDASAIRIRTLTGIKALRKYS